jgi:hypothetical protein
LIPSSFRSFRFHANIRLAAMGIALALVAAAPLGLVAQARHPATYGAMHKVSLDDAQFGMPAYTIEAPAGWKFDGKIRRDIGCSPADPFPAYEFTSPDGQTRIRVLTPFFTAYPASLTQGLDFRQCGIFAQSMPTGRLLTQYIAPALRKGAQIGQPEMTEDGSKWKQQAAHQFPMYSTSGDASQVKLTFNDNGQAMEERIVGMTQITSMGRQGYGFSGTYVTTVTAPSGKLAEAEANLSWATNLVPNPAWTPQEQQRQMQATAQTQAQGERTRAGIAAQGQANMDATRAKMQSTIDAIHATGSASMSAARDSENARHSAAVGTANYVGDKPTQYYRWRNTVTGETKVTNNPTVPGPNWAAY